MKGYLLDTHSFFWWSIEPEKLPTAVLELLADIDARVGFSVVSSWEAQIRTGLGKLELTEPLQTIVERELMKNRWEVLPIHLRHSGHSPVCRRCIATRSTDC